MGSDQSRVEPGGRPATDPRTVSGGVLFALCALLPALHAPGADGSTGGMVPWTIPAVAGLGRAVAPRAAVFAILPGSRCADVCPEHGAPGILRPTKRPRRLRAFFRSALRGNR